MTKVPLKNSSNSGQKIAAFQSYQEAESAVDYLSDRKFPVEHATIVAEGLKMVEKVTGRQTIMQSIASGAVNGLIIGMLIGFIFGLFNVLNPIFSGFIVAVYGAALGLILGGVIGLVVYFFSNRNRDFTSDYSIAADTYFLLVDNEYAADARMLLEDKFGAWLRPAV